MEDFCAEGLCVYIVGVRSYEVQRASSAELERGIRDPVLRDPKHFLRSLHHASCDFGGNYQKLSAACSEMI